MPANQITSTNYNVDTNALFQKKVIPNRLPQFIQFLNQKGIPIQNEFAGLHFVEEIHQRLKNKQRMQNETTYSVQHRRAIWRL